MTAVATDVKRDTSSATRPLRVCVCTSYPAHREPRAPRHAAALAAAGCDVHFVDAAPRGEPRVMVNALRRHPDIQWTTIGVPHRRNGAVPLAVGRAVGVIARTAFAKAGIVSNSALNAGLMGLEEVLTRAPADAYLAHNADTLLPAWRAARRHDALLMFDSMEYHADMGNGQTALEQRLIDQIQRRCLGDCRLVLASSPEVAKALEVDYAINDVLPLPNVPATTSSLSPKLPGFNLYWRNAVVNTGERGLGDVLAALRELPAEIALHLQGRLPADGGARLRAEIAEHGLTERVVFHPPYQPDEAIREASRFQVGLCLERRGHRNHDLTVSNKMFDYHMAGLAVVCSDLPGLKHVVERSGGGLSYRAGDVDDLRATLRQLYDCPELLTRCADAARRFAMTDGNVEREMKMFVQAFAGCVDRHRPQFAGSLRA